MRSIRGWCGQEATIVTMWVLRKCRGLVRRLGRLAEDLRCRALVRKYRIGHRFERLYFFHVRKTGGTSLNHTFLSLGGEDGAQVYERLGSRRPHRIISGDKIFVGWQKRLIEQGNYFYAFSHTPWHKLHLPDETFSLTCIRDPVQRVLSHYRMLVEYKMNNVNHPCMKTEGAWLGSSFNDFLDRSPREHLLSQLHMFSERCDPSEALDRIKACSHCLLTDYFAEGVGNLSRRLGISPTPIHRRRTSTSIEVTPDELARLQTEVKSEVLLYQELEKAMQHA